VLESSGRDPGPSSYLILAPLNAVENRGLGELGFGPIISKLVYQAHKGAMIKVLIYKKVDNYDMENGCELIKKFTC
jgi:hypothetical protein